MWLHLVNVGVREYDIYDLYLGDLEGGGEVWVVKVCYDSRKKTNLSVRDTDSSLLSPETIDFLKLAYSKSLFWDGLGVPSSPHSHKELSIAQEPYTWARAIVPLASTQRAVRDQHHSLSGS